MSEQQIETQNRFNKNYKNVVLDNDLQVFTEKLSHALNEHSVVSISNIKGEIIYANSKFCEVSGYSLDELMGADHNILKSNIHDQAFFKELWKTIASGQTWYGEICNRAKEGHLYWVQSTIVPFLNEETRQPEHYVSIRTEITHQKKIQENLDRLFWQATLANEAKSRFLDNISHELRTPLNHIIGFSEILGMSTKDPDLLESAEYIKQAGHDLLNKISNVLELIGPGDELNKTRETIDIVKLVEVEFAGNFQMMANGALRRFTKSILDQEIHIIADRAELLSAFGKIAENAIRYTSENDIVGVSIAVNNDMVTVEIFDTGPGLPPHILTSRLEPFIIGENVNTKSNSGMGLGLPLAKKLCIKNGGQIELESDSDIGTKILFSFPIV